MAYALLEEYIRNPKLYYKKLKAFYRLGEKLYRKRGNRHRL